MPQNTRKESSETPNTRTDLANRWWALVSPAALREPAGFLTTPHDAGRVLSGPYDLGPIHIAPGERQLVDYVPLFAQGWKSAVSWPVLVFGEIQGSWQETDRAAAKVLHRLCCLLALAWGEPWQVRLAPAPEINLPPRVPDPVLVPNPDHYHDDGNPQIGIRAEAHLPDWISKRWDRLDKADFGGRVQPALSLWHEGILLQPEHPSLAMVSFVASLEQSALSMPEFTRRLGANAKFWLAAESAATAEEIQQLRDAKIYGKRSETSHGSALHGIELEFGFMLLQPIGSEDPTYTFVFRTLQLIRNVSRRCLVNILAS
jgi:hypothetical protein